MSKVKDGNYIVIQSFMVTDLKLKGNELLIYAIIYGFTQDGEHQFNGGNQYLADWLNTSKQTVISNLKSLVNKGLIERKEEIINGVKFFYYQSKNLTGGSQNSLLGVVKKFDPIINNDNKGIDNKSIYGEFQNVLLTEEEYAKVKEGGMLDVLEELSSYIASSGKRYKSHYATILNWSRRKDREQAERNAKNGKMKSKPSFDIEEIKRRSALNDDFDI